MHKDEQLRNTGKGELNRLSNQAHKISNTRKKLITCYDKILQLNAFKEYLGYEKYKFVIGSSVITPLCA
jgi:hypothetical protein